MQTINYMGIDINLTDESVWKFLCSSKNLKGIFQLETYAAANVLSKIKPKNIEDLSLVNALNRPGAQNFTDEIADIRNGDKHSEYIHPALEQFLRNTYGKLVYQEQVMYIAQQLANFKAKESNALLKALGKKKKDVMKAQREAFIKGMVENKYPVDVAEKLFDWFEAFADYSFNKSHSVSYSVMGYSSAFIKYYYPLQFFTSALNFTQHEQSPLEEVGEYINELPFFGIKILPPSIDKISNKCEIEDGNIRYPIGLVRFLGESLYEKLSKLTPNQVATLDSFLESAMNVGLNSRSIESIIISGSLDKFGEREDILFYYWFLSELQPEVLTNFWHFKNGTPFSNELIFKFLEYRTEEEIKLKAKRTKQLDLFSDKPKPAPVNKIKYKSYFKTENTRVKTLEIVKKYLEDVNFFKQSKDLARFIWETKVLGYSYHNKFNQNINTFREITDMIEGDKGVSCGKVVESRFKTSKKGNLYGSLEIKYDSLLEFMLFQKVAEGAKDVIKDGQFVKFSFKKEKEMVKIESIMVVSNEISKYEFYENASKEKKV